jgi:predicted  nucleic acid-binding Zn-ribbon protein
MMRDEEKQAVVAAMRAVDDLAHAISPPRGTREEIEAACDRLDEARNRIRALIIEEKTG